MQLNRIEQKVEIITIVLTLFKNIIVNRYVYCWEKLMKHFSVGCNLEPRDLEDGLRLKRMGIDFYEIGNAVFIDEQHAKTVHLLLEDCGITPWSAHGRYLDRESWPTLEGFEHDCRIAEILGAQVIVTHSPSKLADGAFDLERFSSAAKIAEDHGLKMAIETCHLNDNLPYSTTTYKDLITISDTLYSKNVGINIDTGHVHVGERRDVETVIDEVGDRLLTLHIHDNFGTRDDHQAVGLGFIQWDRVLAALYRSHYEGPLMLELSGSHQERALVKLLGYDNNAYQEIAYSYAWLKFCWDELMLKQERPDK